MLFYQLSFGQLLTIILQPIRSVLILRFVNFVLPLWGDIYKYKYRYIHTFDAVLHQILHSSVGLMITLIYCDSFLCKLTFLCIDFSFLSNLTYFCKSVQKAHLRYLCIYIGFARRILKVRALNELLCATMCPCLESSRRR